jgi:RimJ/RimL family protein N-acetyltransferase
MNDLFTGTLVRLTGESPEAMAEAEKRWQHDSELHRLADGEPAELHSEKKIKEWLEKRLSGEDPRRFPFAIRTLAEDRLIGSMNLYLPVVQGCDAWVGIEIGDREFWGKGYGTDAMCLILGYAFGELNLHHVSLALHAYNTRARRSYEKAGFRLEGCVRQDQLHDGLRTDSLFMGILREEWRKQNDYATGPD